MKIFIAGARAITKFDDNVTNKLSSICEKGYGVLVGDASGVDSSVQKFYADMNYNNVTVFASNGIARNNIGNWNVENIVAKGQGFDFYKQKDIAMANQTDYGFMIWNGESRGTLNNIINLIEQDKTCVVYLLSNRKFFTIKNQDDLLNLLNFCPHSATATYNKLTQTKVSPLAQIALF